eukprot:16168222-Heterocapsa_arctica.AAC.1
MLLSSSSPSHRSRSGRRAIRRADCARLPGHGHPQPSARCTAPCCGPARDDVEPADAVSPGDEVFDRLEIIRVRQGGGIEMAERGVLLGEAGDAGRRTPRLIADAL